MIVWIASSGRSGNTFFRVVMHRLYGVDTYAAFKASEVLITAGTEGLVGHKELPKNLQAAVAAADPGQIRLALEELESSRELFVFKTHAMAHDLFGTHYRAILVVRDGRDALTSYANYLVDIRFDSAAFTNTLRKMARLKSQLLNRRAWIHLAKIFVMAAFGKPGLRRWLVSRKIQRLLSPDHELYFDWSRGNHSWLQHDPKPIIVYFDDLTRDPIGTVTRAVDSLGIGLVAKSNSSVPSFAELKKCYPSFFRRGISGDWRNHFTPAQEELFRSQHGEMMKTLNFRVLDE